MFSACHGVFILFFGPDRSIIVLMAALMTTRRRATEIVPADARRSIDWTGNDGENTLVTATNRKRLKKLWNANEGHVLSGFSHRRWHVSSLYFILSDNGIHSKRFDHNRYYFYFFLLLLLYVHIYIYIYKLPIYFGVGVHWKLQWFRIAEYRLQSTYYSRFPLFDAFVTLYDYNTST